MKIIIVMKNLSHIHNPASISAIAVGLLMLGISWLWTSIETSVAASTGIVGLLMVVLGIAAFKA